MKKSILITLIVLCVSLFVTVTAVYAEDGGAGGSDKPVTYTSVEEVSSGQEISGGEPLASSWYPRLSLYTAGR